MSINTTELIRMAKETCTEANTNDRHTRLNWNLGINLVKQIPMRQVAAIMKDLIANPPTENGEAETVDGVINFWCASADEGLMFYVAKEVYGYDE
jgi:hypothetical protein